MLLSGPEERPKPHSEKKLDGDGRRASETKRLGRAEIGVSMLLFEAYEVVLTVFCAAVVVGGGGLANGFGGPVAPALSIALADGDGGGRTTPLWFPSCALAGVVTLFPPESRDDDSAVALPRSEFSEGICTLSCGRFESWPLLGRGVASAMAGIDVLDWGSVSAVIDKRWAPDWGCWLNAPGFESTRSGSAGPTGKYRARTDPRSSIGVKILRDFDETAFGCGGEGFSSVFTGCACSDGASVYGTARPCSGAKLGGTELLLCSA